MESTLAPLNNRVASSISPRPSPINMNENCWYLKKSAVFEHLSSEELSVLESECQVREFSRGDVVYFPSDSGDFASIVVKGRVRIYHLTGEGKQAILGFVDSGEMFGELSAFSGTTRDEYAEAIEKSVVVTIPRHALIQTIERDSTAARKFTQLFGQRVRQVERRLKSLLFGSSRERLRDLLTDLAEQYGNRTPTGTVITQKISHQDLASIIGATRETVTITLGEMQAEGLIEINNRRITLCHTEPQQSAM